MYRLSIEFKQFLILFSLLKDVIENDSVGWKTASQKLLNYIESDFNGKTAFSVFAKNGNKKLPFYAFSSLALGLKSPAFHDISRV